MERRSWGGVGHGWVLLILIVLGMDAKGYTEWRQPGGLHGSRDTRCLPLKMTPPTLQDVCGIPPKAYAQVTHFPAPVYRGADQPYLLKPKRLLHKGFVWVSVESKNIVEYKGREWIKINSDEFIEMRHLALRASSTFRGVELGGRKGGRCLPFIWLILDTTPSRVPGGPMDYNATTIARYTMLSFKRVKHVDGLDWYEVGKNKWINQKRLALVRYRPRPKGVGPGQKWICVDLYEQTLTAYDGDIPVYATLISSGRDGFPTVRGLFRIWLKVREKKMSGFEHTPDYYYLEDVPWQMYFYNGYAIHSSYWHDRFGIPQSSGCINVAPYDACWLYHWTGPRVQPGQKAIRATGDNPGTWVYVTQQ